MNQEPLKSTYAVINRELVDFDTEIVEAILATTLTNFIAAPPVWLLLIAPPSSGKTLALSPLEGIFGPNKPYLLSDITENTLLSGLQTKSNTDPSLLTKLGDNPLIVIKEMGTALEKSDNGAIFAQLREVYDGKMRKVTGMGTHRYWQGNATMLIGMTPKFDDYNDANSALGDRFLKLRFQPREDYFHAAMETLLKDRDERDIQREIKEAYTETLFAAKENLDKVNLSRNTWKKISAASCILEKFRTPVQRTHAAGGHQVKAVFEQAGVQRITKILNRFCAALAALRGEEDLTDFKLLKRLALSSGTNTRRSVFVAVARANAQGEEPEAKDLDIRLGSSSIYMHLEDLFLVGMLDRREKQTVSPGKNPKVYKVNEEIQSHFDTLGVK